MEERSNEMNKLEGNEPKRYKLAHLISRRGITSRRKAEQLIEEGRILVNGAVVKCCAERFSEEVRIEIIQTMRVRNYQYSQRPDERQPNEINKDKNSDMSQHLQERMEEERGDKNLGNRTYHQQSREVRILQDKSESNREQAREQRNAWTKTALNQTTPRLFLYHKEPWYLVSHSPQFGKETIFDAIAQNPHKFRPLNECKQGIIEKERNVATTEKLEGKASEEREDGSKIGWSKSDDDKITSRRNYKSDKPHNHSVLPYCTFVGRLDYLSEGLLLLTNSLAHELSQPGLKRVYEIETSHVSRFLESFLQRPIMEGIELMPIELIDIQTTQNHRFTIKLGLFEGKNREIRYIFKLLQMPIFRLKRISYGRFTLGNLKPGELMEISANVRS